MWRIICHIHRSADGKKMSETGMQRARNQVPEYLVRQVVGLTIMKNVKQIMIHKEIMKLNDLPLINMKSIWLSTKNANNYGNNTKYCRNILKNRFIVIETISFFQANYSVPHGPQTFPDASYIVPKSVQKPSFKSTSTCIRFGGLKS